MAADPVSTTTKAAPESVDPEIEAYQGSHWDGKHVLTDGEYAGFEVGLCRPDPTMGGRVKVVSKSEGGDRFSANDIRALQRLTGVAPRSRVFMLDREAAEKGHICIQATDGHWASTQAERLEETPWYDPFSWSNTKCEEALIKFDEAEKKCDAVVKTLRGMESPGFVDKITDSTIIGTGFAIGGAILVGAWKAFNILATRANPVLLLMNFMGPGILRPGGGNDGA